MSNKIKLNYYDAFRCLADQCPYTCCQEWEITIDDDTQEKWKDVNMTALGLGDDKKPERKLCDCLKKQDSSYIMSLEEDKKCPFLSQNQLCKVVVEMGEEYISEICKMYPRYINPFQDREEYSLDFGCPAVIDLIHNQQETVEFITDDEEECVVSILDQVREMILDIMKDEHYSLTERIMVSAHCLFELLEEEELTEETIEAYGSAEYLEPLVEELRKLEFDPSDSFWERNELFQDIVQFYCKEELYGEYVEEISMWARRLEEWYSDSDLLEKNKQFEMQYIRYEKLLTNYLLAEIWASCLKVDSTLEDMVMVFQWIVLEYCSMRQAIFLKWLSEDEEEVEYTMVRDYMMIISRMAGYDQSDIKNCLLHSFDCTLLEWGYLALVLGNGSV